MYDKSDLIKETFINALNKKISIYGSIGYFHKKKTENEIFKIVTREEILKFYINRLTSVSGKIPKLKDKKIYNLSFNYNRRKKQTAKQIETVIICAKQNFEIAGGLNLVQIEIEDDRILHMLKRYKNTVYRLTPFGFLFPASLKNNTEQIFVTSRKLGNINKIWINSKIYGLLWIIDLKK